MRFFVPAPHRCGGPGWTDILNEATSIPGMLQRLLPPVFSDVILFTGQHHPASDLLRTELLEVPS
jgi:hypothetical protein